MRKTLQVLSVLLLLAGWAAPAARAEQGSQKSPAASAAPPPSSPAALSAVLNAIGAVGVADIYMAYMAVGTVADAYAYGNKGYEKQSVSSIMTILASLTDTARKALQSLLDGGLLEAQDAETAVELVRAYEAINHQAMEFIRYLSTGEIGDYEQYRRKAWAVIAKLYGFGG